VEEGEETTGALPPFRPRFPLFLRLYVSDISNKASKKEGEREGGRDGGAAFVNLEAPSLPVDVTEKGRKTTGGGGLSSLPPFLPGRPDLPRLLKAWCNPEEGKGEGGREGGREGRRGVVVCGPEGMLWQVREAVVRTKGRVDLHEEVFQW